MTVKELLNFFESYYGEKYTGIFLDVMLDYLEDCSDEFLLAVRKTMVLRFSRIYNKVPCPADIEKNMDEILSVMSAPKVYLPEPEEPRATPEEAQIFHEQLMAMLKTKKGGAMAKPLNELVNSIAN